MKSIVNNIPTTRWGQDEFHVQGIIGDNHNIVNICNTLQTTFMDILYAIQLSNNEKELRANMYYLSTDNTNFRVYFQFGFDAHGMWVKQVDWKGNTQGGNIIYVEL